MWKIGLTKRSGAVRMSGPAETAGLRKRNGPAKKGKANDPLYLVPAGKSTPMFKRKSEKSNIYRPKFKESP